MSDPSPPPLEPAVRALGYAGLLPQTIALVAVAVGGPDWSARAMVAALLYAALILSFLGGIWWGFVVHRAGGQAGLALVAVIPSLVAFALLLGVFEAVNAGMPVDSVYLAGAIGLGVALLATLAVDRHLMRVGDAPPGWLRFRAILSLGLAGQTVAAGVIFYRLTETVTLV